MWDHVTHTSFSHGAFLCKHCPHTRQSRSRDKCTHCHNTDCTAPCTVTSFKTLAFLPPTLYNTYISLQSTWCTYYHYCHVSGEFVSNEMWWPGGLITWVGWCIAHFLPVSSCSLCASVRRELLLLDQCCASYAGYLQPFSSYYLTLFLHLLCSDFRSSIPLLSNI